MIMQVVINAVPPASAPAVAFEDILEDSVRIERTRQANGTPQNEQGKRGWLGVTPSSLNRIAPTFPGRGKASSWPSAGRCHPVIFSVVFLMSSSSDRTLLRK
jgi:hypothetical protein